MSANATSQASSLVAATLLVACGGSSSMVVNPPPPPPPSPPGPPVAAATVEVRNNFFTPETVSLIVGGTVTWTWVGQDHTVTSVLSPSFGPNTAIENAPFTHGPIRFPTAGTFQYICTVHGGVANGQTTGMRGVMIV